MGAPELQFAVTYQNLATFAQEFQSNLVNNGVYLKTGKDIQLGKPVGIHFRFKQEQIKLFGVGSVAWVDPARDPASGRVTFLVRNLRLNAESQAAVNAALGDASIEEVSVPGAAAPPSSVVPPVAPSPSAAAAQQSHASPLGHRHHRPSAVGAGSAATAAPKKEKMTMRKRVLVLLLVLSALGGMVAGWLFGLGGVEVIMTRFFPPPQRMLAAPAPPLPSAPRTPFGQKRGCAATSKDCSSRES